MISILLVMLKMPRNHSFIIVIAETNFSMLTVGMMNFPVRRQTAGMVQYASRGMEVNG